MFLDLSSDSGWGKISIGDWSDRISDVFNDAPFELLYLFIDSCKNHKPSSMKFDAEGYEYILTIDWNCVYIITETEDDEVTFKKIEVNRDELARELISDIRNNIDSCVDWCLDKLDNKQREERAFNLELKCKVLEGNLPSDDYVLIYKRED